MSSDRAKPLERTLEANFYTDPAIFSLERQRIFRRAWHIVGHLSAWHAAGRFRSAEIGGAKVFVVRGQDGKLRAFRNICRHRAARLVDGDGVVACNTIRCPYHGWEYGLDGRLLETPWFGEQTPFDLADLSLVSVGLEVWRGLVFVALDPDREVVDQLGEMPSLLADVPLEDMVEFDSRAFVEPFNWKTYVDQFTEYYHSPAVHGSGAEVGIDRFTALPIEQGMVMSAPAGLAFYGGTWVWTWPNFTIATFEGGVKISTIIPLSPQESEVRFLFLADQPSDVAPRGRQHVVDATFVIFAQDAAVLGRVQANLASGMFDTPGPLHPRHEQATAYFQRLVRSALA